MAFFDQSIGHRKLKFYTVTYQTNICNFGFISFAQNITFLKVKIAPKSSSSTTTLTVPWSGLRRRQKHVRFSIPGKNDTSAEISVSRTQGKNKREKKTKKSVISWKLLQLYGMKSAWVPDSLHLTTRERVLKSISRNYFPKEQTNRRNLLFPLFEVCQLYNERP